MQCWSQLLPVTETKIRLQKVLAAAGIGSRRACEVLIDQGRVSINGETVTGQGRRVDPEVDVIHVDGERLQTKAEIVVYAFNKPKGVLTTMVDDQGRPCVGDYVTDLERRVFHVGRLDADTEGLLLLTNDGELANRLIHPSFGVDKTYIATVKELANQALASLMSGIELDDGMVKAAKARIMDRAKNAVMVELVIHEGRNRIVRRMFDAVGSPVTALVRTKMGPIALGQQRPGVIRVINGPQLRALYTAAGL
jgi:23S rRNA pseudouridine2605 synthase